MSKQYTYLGTCDSGMVKIGKSKDPRKREGQIRNMNPTFTIFFEKLVENMDVEEKRLHSLFLEKRVDGEWFDLAPKDVCSIMGNENPTEEELRLIGVVIGGI